METVMLPSIPTSKVGVSDVISSVRSIMASEMAQHEQQQEKVVVIQAQSPSTGKQIIMRHFHPHNLQLFNLFQMKLPLQLLPVKLKLMLSYCRNPLK
jgi:hypothetical protein